MIEIAMLLAHVAIAISSLIVAILSMKDTSTKAQAEAKKKLKLAWVGTGLTTGSGVVLAIVSHVSFGKLCVSLLMFLIVISVAQSYYSLALRSPGSLKLK